MSSSTFWNCSLRDRCVAATAGLKYSQNNAVHSLICVTFSETLQRWLAFGETASDLIVPGSPPKTSSIMMNGKIQKLCWPR